MVLDRVHGEVQALGDLLILEAFGDQAQDLELARRQLEELELLVAPPFAAQLGQVREEQVSDARRADRRPRGHAQDRLAQLGERLVVEQVALRALAQQAQRFLLPVLGPQHQDLGLGQERPRLPQQLPEARRVAAAQYQDVHRPRRGKPGQRRALRVRHRHPREAAVVAQRRGQALAEQPMSVEDEQPDRLRERRRR